MSARDVVLFAVVVVAFAALVTAHVWIAVGLLTRAPRWRAPLAFFVPPLAPYWALREKMRVRGVAWIAGFVTYVIVFVVAMRS